MLSFTLSHVHDVVRSLWPKMLATAEEKQIELTFQPVYDIPVVYIDNRRIGQVIMCLAQNAIKFTEKGGTVSVVTERTDDGVVVRVADTGQGIPEEKMPRIFDTFKQLDGSSTRRSGGLGIGLAIAKHIIELHGGMIWAESKSGTGSMFAFMVPVGTAEFLRSRQEGVVVSARTASIIPGDLDGPLGETD
jgi:signal transduction histidine kinase